MKGLLHRLADRAAGASLTVHSDARLPFSADRLDEREAPRSADDGPMPDERSTPARTVKSAKTEANETPVETLGTTRSGPPLETQVATSGAPTLHQASLSGPSPPVRSTFSSSLSPRASSGVEASGTAPPAQRSSRSRAASTDPFDMRHTDPDRPVRKSASQEENESMPEPGDAPWPIAPILAAPEDAQRQPVGQSAARARMTLVPQELATMLTPRDVGAENSRQDVPAHGDVRSSMTEGRASDDTTEVHVHIGCIEVTAVHDVPTVRAQRDKQQSPVSLETYLAGREKS